MTRSESTRRIIIALGALMSLYLLAYHSREVSKFHTWSESGFRESQLIEVAGQNSVVVFQSVVPMDFVSAPYPAAGDTVLTINDLSAVEWAGQPPAAHVPISVAFVHDGTIQIAAFAMETPPRALTLGVGGCVLLRFLIAFSSLALGFVALRPRNFSTVTQIFAQYSFAIAALVSLHYFLLPGSYATFSIPVNDSIFRFWFFFGSLFGGFWLHLVYLYPQPLKWTRQHSIFMYLLCYGPAFLLLLLWMNAVRQNAPVLALASPEAATLASVLVAVVPILISFGVLLYRYRTGPPLQVRQVRLLLWAVAAGFVVQNVSALIGHLFPVWYNAHLSRTLIFVTLTFVVLLLGPVSFAYAFRKYRLMDIEAKLRRATRFALITGLLVVALAIAAYGISVLLLSGIGGSSRIYGVTVAVALALAIPPLERRLNRQVERRLYPGRARLRLLLHEFLERTSTLPDIDSFTQQLQAHVQEGLKVGFVRPVLRNDADFPFAEDSPLVKYLLHTRRPLLLDEASESGRVPLRTDEGAWLRANRAGLIVPLVLHRRLTGFLAIGLRTDNEDYDAEELQILNSLAPQISVAIENLRLLEENVEKQRLAKELASARKTQENLLPRSLPDVPGLEMAATCQFCLEVAGDYYDVIPLSGGRTAFAIADVSGKGAAAALLMASVQAALHTTVGTDSSLSNLVEGINRLICRNARLGQFVTFFVAIHDPATSMLTYVNAGHNPPMLMRADGTCSVLDAGGVILGCVPGASYQQGIARPRPGDTLLLYTDGVTETRNEHDDMFTEARLGELLLERRISPPTEILQAVEMAAAKHHGASTFEDDFTLLVVRWT